MEEARYVKRKEKALSEGKLDQLAVACNSLGDFYNQQGKYQNAVCEYQQEADLYVKLGKKLEMAKAQRMVGEMFMLLCEFDNANEHINIYLKTVKKLQNKVEEQRAYATLGRAHLLHGQSTSETSASTTVQQLKMAERAFLKSLLLIKELTGQISKLEQLDMQARCYLNIGVVKQHMEDFEESVSYIEKAIKISKTHDIFELTHLCYISMSWLYFHKKHDSTLALRYCNLALEIAKRLPNKVKKICETLITKSEILIKEGDFASAKQILTKAYKKNTADENDRQAIEKNLRIVVKICQILDDLVTTSSVDYEKLKCFYEKLGDGCCHLQNYNKALEYYLKMLECAQLNADSNKNIIPIYVSLYQTYKDDKQYEKALEYLWKEYDLNKDEPAEAFFTLCGIAEVCELQIQSFWTIQDIYQKAKEHVEKAGTDREKLEKIVYMRLKKLMLKYKMNALADELIQDAGNKGIDLNGAEDDSDSESEANCNDQNTPELGDDVCLDELTDNDMSDLDETDKPQPHRATRGVRCLTIKRNTKGETQLHQSCIAGNLELARRLIDQGHVVNVRDHAGWIPLHEACNHGFRDIAELLLDKGAAINDKGGTSCDGITPLYDACSNGYLDVVELLLERGADATVKTDFGETCLNGLDKWRRSATLTESEQAEYLQVRAQLLTPLSKVGICQNMRPLTNANVLTSNSESLGEEEETEKSARIHEENDITASALRRRSDHNRSAEDRNKGLKASRSNRASFDYKNVMEQVKHPNRAPTLDDDHYANSTNSSLSSVVKQKRSALLNEEEIDDNTWLIDDTGPEKKKRCYYSETTRGQHSNNTSTTTRAPSSKENLHDSANCTWEDMESLTPPETDAFQVLLDAATATTSTQQRQKQRQKLRLSGSSSISNNAGGNNQSKRKQQASLLDSGFCRFRSESPISSEDSTDTISLMNIRTTEPDSTTASSTIHLVISPKKSSPAKLLVPTVAFKVKVEEELLLIPVDRKKLADINIRWLAEETARRYYNLVGLKPVLRLKTADGFAYEENDSVNVAIEQNMILATVLEWKLSPLAQRYDEMCRQLNKDINPDVQTVLERAQLSNIINFRNFWLTPQLTEPVFKAVLHQTNLRVLDLSNNFIQNEGCRQLAKSLPTLKQLKSLNLKGNFITCEGLDALLTCDGIENLSELEELNLSQNPLGNTCIRILDKFCNGAAAKSLQMLLLSHCNLINMYDFDLCYYQLNEFDISYNQLTDDSKRKLLSKLNSSRLQHLNLSYSRSTYTDERSNIAYAENIVEFFESGTCEKFKCINLCGCNLSDANIYKIVQCLKKANDLELLNVTDNEQLTANALQFILDKIPQLRKLIAVNCCGLVDSERVIKLAQLKHIPNFMSLTLQGNSEEHELRQNLRNLWQSHWGNKARVKSYAAQLILYVNDADLGM